MRSKEILAALAAATTALAFSGISQAQPVDPGAQPVQPGAAAPGPSVTIPLSGNQAPSAAATPAVTGQDQPVPSKAPAGEPAEPKPLPIHGSILLIDQSATGNSMGIGKDYQSANPVYELWFSFRPRYYLYEDDFNALNVNLRMDIYHELTNSDSTTRKNESSFGDIWINASYARTLVKSGDWVTKVSTGPRILLPTSKDSYMAGKYLTAGWGVGAEQGVPFAGKGSTWFPGATFRGSAYYTHHFYRATTATNENLNQARQDSGGRSFMSDQLSGAVTAKHQVLAAVVADVSVHEKVTLGLSYIWILQWAHSFDKATISNVLTGPVQPAGVSDPTTFRVLPWFLANVDYDLMPEVTLGVGYYNLANQVGPDGQRRNPLWSPDARFFFDITANLDEIYSTLSGHREKQAAPQQAATPTKTAGNHAAAQDARMRTLQTMNSF